MTIQQFPTPSSAGLTYLSGPTTARPSSPVSGQNYFNTTNNALEIYNGTAWVNLIVPASAPVWNSPAENTTLANVLDATSSSYSSFSVTDPEGNGITWAASSLPSGLSINSGNGTISGTVSVGVTTTTTYNINVFAIDTGGNISGRRFNWVVRPSIDTSFLVIAGGGGATSAANNNGMGGGGGGAGGYRTSAGTSGANSAAEATLKLSPGTAYSIRVGAGGAVSAQGSNSVFDTITSTGGGFASNSNLGAGNGTRTGGTGGSGGGNGGSQYSPFNLPGLGTANQGRDGAGPQQRTGGGGGGASANGALGVGGNPPSAGGAGGAGLASTITGSSVTRGGGGGGAGQSGTGGAGGTGGGGAGGNTGQTGNAGTANTGGGGGGGTGYLAGGAGGSGVVILSIPNTFTATFSGGVTSASTSTGGRNVYIVTAAGTSDTVTFS